MSVSCRTRQSGNVAIIDLAGRITLSGGSAALRDAIRDCTDKGQNNILLNFSETSYIDSAGIGELVGGFTTVADLGGQLKLENIGKTTCAGTSFAAILKDTQLHSVFAPIYESDEAAAVQSFSGNAYTSPVNVRLGGLAESVPGEI